MVDRGPCDVSQPGTDVSTRGRREVADRRGSTRSTPGPAAASRRARHARRLARRRTVGVLRGGSVRVTAQTRAQTIPPAPRGAANFVPSRNDTHTSAVYTL